MLKPVSLTPNAPDMRPACAVAMQGAQACAGKTSPHAVLLRRGAALLAVCAQFFMALPAAHATELPPGLSGLVTHFLTGQNTQKGDVSVAVALPNETPLPGCSQYEPFMPPNSRSVGRFPVGIRCSAAASADGTAWTRYVEATVNVMGTYYTLNRPVQSGEIISASDLTPARGDLGKLPRGVLTAEADIVGKSATYRIGPDTPIRADMVRGATVVKSGQNVKMISQGAGFVITTEGKAMTNGMVGKMLQVRTQANQTMTGIVQADGTVAINN